MSAGPGGMATRRLAIVSDRVAGELHGLQGRFPWGEAVTVGPEAVSTLRELSPDAVVAIGGAEAAEVEPSRLVRWLAAPPGGSAEGPSTGPWGSSARVIAPGGEGAWRRSPLPVNDEVFAPHGAGDGRGVLVAGGSAERRTAMVDSLHGRRVEAAARERLERSDLSRVAVVVLLGDPGAPLPGEAMAVLAARRVLVAPRADPAFGLFPGIDHLAYESDYEAAQYADPVATDPSAFEALRAMGAVAAHRHRASVVYGRLAIDLAVEAGALTAPRPPAEPRD